MEILPELPPAGIFLFLAPGRLLQNIMATLTAELALVRQVHVLDGGNSFKVHDVIRALRQHTPRYQAVLNRVTIARAFTCYQVLALLAESPVEQTPTLMSALLTTFYDENISLSERRRLLHECLDHLRKLSRRAPLLVSAAPQSDELLSTLMSAADHIWRFEAPETSPLQLKLF